MCINYKIDSLSTVVYTLAYLAIETIAAVELEKQKKYRNKDSSKVYMSIHLEGKIIHYRDDFQDGEATRWKRPSSMASGAGLDILSSILLVATEHKGRERENSYRCVITICISSLRSNSIEFEFLYFFPPKRKYQSRFSGETTGGNGCAHFLSTLGSAVFGSSRPRSLWKRVLDTRHFDEPKPIG